MPAHFSLSDQSFQIDEKKPFDVAIKATDIPLQNLFVKNPFINALSGILNIDIRAENTLSDISPHGSISIDKGLIKNDKYGVELNSLDMKLLIKPDSLVLKQFKAIQDKGSIDLNYSRLSMETSFPALSRLSL